MNRFFCILSLLIATGCSTTYKPCTTGGDIAFDPSVKGNKMCNQARRADGSWVNNGKYIEYYPSGRVGVEGEFSFGKKIGKWIRYDEQGKKVSEKFFADGAEVPELKQGMPLSAGQVDKPIQVHLGAAPVQAGTTLPAAPAQSQAAPSPSPRPQSP